MDDFREQIAFYAEEPLTRQVILNLLKDYKRPNDKINELIKKGFLSNVIKGLYIPGPRLKIAGPEKFLIANHLRGPSYVSVESALSYWKLIPERVHEVSSITMKLSKTYNTPAGRYSYISLPLPYYSFGIQRVQLTSKQSVLIASPEKAICDKIVTTSGILLRSPQQVKDLLIEDLRMDEERLKQLNLEFINSWLPDAPKKKSLEMLVKALRNL